MKYPTISIIMPVLNRGDMLEKAICSVLNQHYDHTELIILDGGSTDNTIDIIKRYEKHITYWHSAPDGSAAVATNTGIKKAKGELIALLMSDDYYEPGLFHHIANATHAHPEADLYTCAGRIISCDEKTLAVYDSPRDLALTLHNICYGATAICFRFIRASLYERIGLYIPFFADQKQMLTNDKEFLLRALFYGVQNVFVNHLGYTHVAHEGSYSFGRQPSTFVRHCVEHMDIAEKYLSGAETGGMKNFLLKFIKNAFPLRGKVPNGRKGELKLPQKCLNSPIPPLPPKGEGILNELQQEILPIPSFRQKLFLRIWHADQMAKLFLFQLMKRNFRAALELCLRGIKKYLLLWPVIVSVVGMRAVCIRFGA